MQIHVGLRQRGWSGRTRDLSPAGFLLYLFVYSSARARTDGWMLTINASYDAEY